MATAAPDSTKNLDMGTLMARFRCEDRCRDYLEQLRWPEGVRCPRCEADKVFPLEGRNQYECGNGECGYQFSVTVGTKLQDSKLPLWKWFLAVYLMIHAKKGISAKQLQSMLGGSYKTSWFLCQRIRAAMKELDQEPLSGVVEIDETFVGGKKKGSGQGSYHKHRPVVMGAVSRDGKARFRVVPNRQSKHVLAFVKDTTGKDTEAIYTDSLPTYRGMDSGRNTKHRAVNKFKGEWVSGKVHTNTVEGIFSLLDRSIIGAYHKVSRKHLQAYLDEVAFKYNNRRNPYLFRDTLVALIGTESLTYARLVDKQ